MGVLGREVPVSATRWEYQAGKLHTYYATIVVGQEFTFLAARWAYLCSEFSSHLSYILMLHWNPGVSCIFWDYAP
jgi:hypothetical protein